ncbi:hypothetical protein GGR50DRAFT_488212 [Xylaria sp. CBS 124048]|nr:hypothetical protein GGR50DRAFT_488212 [Xylaria sp. CBS 124048]
MSLFPPDPYRILGVPKDAQIPEIRSAHRKLVLKCHPDKIQDPALKEAKQIEFQQVQQAYELLSDEVERAKYDRKAEMMDLGREREKPKNSSSTPPPPPPPPARPSSTPKREPVYYNVREVSPRAGTFSAKPSPFGRTPPRTWEEPTPARSFEEPAHHPRKSASYEKEKSSKRDEERRRRKEEEERAREKELREARKAKERKEEKERMSRDREEREKEKRKEEKKKAQGDREKEREKDRKNATSEKHRTRQPVIIEESDSPSDDNEDVIYESTPPKMDRKRSNTSRKMEDTEPLSTSERTRKLSGHLESAIRYLERSGGNAATVFTRSQTYSEGPKNLNPLVPVPTPPPAASPFAPPPPVNETAESSDDDVRRSSARNPRRRMSHDASRSSREKPSHKKSSSSRDHQPIIVEGEPSRTRTMPSLSRSHTESYARPIPVPSMSRSKTWYPSTEREHERRERSRSRPTPTFSDEDESEAERERVTRGRRNTSPEPMAAPPQIHHRYTVDGTKSMPMRQKQYHEQMPRGSYKTKAAFVTPHTTTRSRRTHTGYVREYYDGEEPAHHFSKVSYAQQFDEGDIRYSPLAYSRSCRPDVWAA